MIAVLHMDWPFAVVCVAAIIAAVVVYGIRKAASDTAASRGRTTAEDD